MVTVTDGIPTGREKAVGANNAPSSFSFSPHVNRLGGGANAVWRF
jgi:hypothetical protein